MDGELKRRWVEALRSGKYKQTTGELRTADPDNCSYCCLGVLADLVNPDGWNEKGVITFNVDGTPDQYVDDLPVTIVDQSHQQLLIQRNDEWRWTFPAIADWIEENIDGT